MKSVKPSLAACRLEFSQDSRSVAIEFIPIPRLGQPIFVQRESRLGLNVLKAGCAGRTSMRAGSCRLARAAGNLGWIQNRKVTCQSRNTIDGASSQTNDTNKACG